MMLWLAAHASKRGHRHVVKLHSSTCVLNSDSGVMVTMP